jgi:hypothetical protein
VSEDSAVARLLRSSTHALAQIDSIVEGSLARSRELEQARHGITGAGTNVDAVVSLACAHGAEADAFTALNAAVRALEQEIAHLSAIGRAGS